MCLEGRNNKRAYWDRKRDNTISGVCVDERESVIQSLKERLVAAERSRKKVIM